MTTLKEQYNNLIVVAQNKLNEWCHNNIKLKGLESIKLKHPFVDNAEVDWFRYDELTADGELYSSSHKFKINVESTDNLECFIELIDDLIKEN